MTAKEARQEQWKKLQDKPLSAKLKYIFTYYWAAIFGVLFAIIFVTSWIGFALTQKDVVLSGCLLNGTTLESYQGSITEEFLLDQQIDPGDCTFDLMADTYYSDMDVYLLESIVTRIATRELDFLVTDMDTCPIFSAHFADLETILTDELLEKYSPYFVYVERSALETLKEGDQGAGLALPEYYLDRTDLEDPIPLGIRIPDSSRLFEAYSFTGDNVVFGIASTTQRLSTTLAFLDYIFQAQ